jgi:protein phosphatase 1 regulatory subunit 37
MASPTASCAPSSSAVTIPTPGKSILKRPPPSQQSFFSRISKFLPTQSQPQVTAGDETRTLRRAHFILPELVTVYPISAASPPSTPTLKDEKKSIEQREAERRWRVVRGNSVSQGGDPDEWWSLEKVESFYRECCTSRDDPPLPEISAAFRVIHHPSFLYASHCRPDCLQDIPAHH